MYVHLRHTRNCGPNMDFELMDTIAFVLALTKRLLDQLVIFTVKTLAITSADPRSLICFVAIDGGMLHKWCVS